MNKSNKPGAAVARVALAALAAVVAGCGNDKGALQGYAEGDFVYVGSPYAGTLEELAVARGQQVAAGATLFVIEHGVEQGALDAASARIRNAQARLQNLGESRRASEIDALRAQVESANTALRLATVQLDQAQKLFKDKFVSQARLDEANANYDGAKARVAESKAQLELGLQSLGRKPEMQAMRAEIEAAQAEHAQAQVRLDQKTGVAPAAGIVYDTFFRVGESVPAGSPVVSLLPPANIKARFYVPETIVGALAPKQGVTIHCDGCAAPIAAEITFISPQAEYTPPVIYSRESRAKLVFLVEARPAPADAPKLRPGQPLEVTLNK
jgi:HlyD family secretion protein